MPNQRDSRKKMLGVYLSEEEYTSLKEISKIKGISMTELVKQFILEYAEGKHENTDDKN
jgi:hypothetical protein